MVKRWGALLFFAAMIFFTTYLACHAAIPTDNAFIKNNPTIVKNLIYSMGGLISALFMYTFNRFNKSLDTLNVNLTLLNGKMGKIEVDVGKLEQSVLDLKDK